MSEIPEVLKIGGLDVQIPDAAQKLAQLHKDGTTFAQVSVAPASLIPPLQLQGQDSVPLSDTRFTLGGSFDARLAVSVFNEVGDKDDDQILLPIDGRAWLKHELAAAIKGSAGGKVGDLEFGLQGEIGARLLQYRTHALDQTVSSGMVADVTSFLLPLRVDDIGKLQDGDILACTVRGKLAFHAKLTWADALTAALSSLDERLGATGASAIKVELGASIGINLTVEDDYRLVFRRGSTADTTQVEVRKTKGRTFGGSAGFNLEASIADPEALQKALTAYATARLAQPWARVQDLIRRIDAIAAFENLNADDRALAEAIGGRLGLTDVRQQWQELKGRLTKLPQDLHARLEAALKTQVKIEMKLEYTRVQTEEVVLACELAKAALVKHHQELLRGNLTALLDRLAASAKGYRLIEYLKTTTITKQFSFGFSIGIGKWGAFGMDKTVRETKRQVDLKEEHERLSFTGRKTYDAKWGDKTFQYAFSLAAAMNRFSSGRAANASEFDYSLAFHWHWQEPLTATLLADALDLANVWHVLPQEENEANLSEALTLGNGPALIEVEIKITDDGVRSLLATPPAVLEKAWIEAMAAALPRVHRQGKVFRSRVRDRVSVYGKAAELAFEDAWAEIAAIAGRIEYRQNDPNALDLLQRIDQGKIPDGALPDLGLKVLWTSTTGNTRPSGRFQRAKEALGRLTEAISGNERPEQIAKTFDQLEDLITRPYECRLLGRVVAGLVMARRPGEIMKSVKVTPDGGSQAILI
jgi:hypothetical protein